MVKEIDKLPLHTLILNIGSSNNGIYLLYREIKGILTLVYVGKSSGSSSCKIKGRLNAAFRKIDGRENISISEMRCKFFTLEERIVPIEELLIDHFKPEWNHCGFGHREGADNHWPRDTSDWDLKYPLKGKKVAKWKFKTDKKIKEVMS
jgi:hypothetical protein